MKKALVFLLLISSSYAFPEINTFESDLENTNAKFSKDGCTLPET